MTMPEATDAYLARPLLRLELAYANMRRPRGVRESTMSYGDDPRQALQLYLPDSNRTRRHLVFYVHGDGWSGGSPRRARFIATFLAEAGYAVAVCGYRPAPQSIFPAQLEDVFSAASAVLARAEELRIDERITLAGFGSGAQLVSLLAFDAEQQARHCLPSESFAGVLALSGILDFSLCRDDEVCKNIRKLMGGRRGWDAADPIRHVEGTESVPVLVVNGGDDSIAPADAARAFVMKVNGGREDGPARLLCLPGATHDDVLRIFIERRKETDEVLEWLNARATEEAPPVKRPELCVVEPNPPKKGRSSG